MFKGKKTKSHNELLDLLFISFILESDNVETIKEKLLRVDYYLSNSLVYKDYNKFWESICKFSNIPYYERNTKQLIDGEKIIEELAPKLFGHPFASELRNGKWKEQAAFTELLLN